MAKDYRIFEILLESCEFGVQFWNHGIARVCTEQNYGGQDALRNFSKFDEFSNHVEESETVYVDCLEILLNVLPHADCFEKQKEDQKSLFLVRICNLIVNLLQCKRVYFQV